MLIGYARVSTLGRNPQFQIEELRRAGCEKIFVEKRSGAKENRPQLRVALEYARADDTLVVWKLSRLARSLTQVIATVRDLEARGINLQALTQKIDTTTPEGRLFFHINAAFDQSQREISAKTRTHRRTSENYDRRSPETNLHKKLRLEKIYRNQMKFEWE